MTGTFTYTFDTPTYKGSATVHTGLFINGEWVKPVNETATIDVINPGTFNLTRTAYKTSWGLKVPGSQRSRLLNKLADLVEERLDEFTALEALDTGKTFHNARAHDITGSIAVLRYFAGWADKVQGKTIETNETKLAYTRHEPFGVVGQIIPWNFPFIMLVCKIGPALATGNTVVLKASELFSPPAIHLYLDFQPSEMTPLTALKIAGLFNEAGFPPGVVNIVNGYGPTAGAAIASHPHIAKVAFTGSVGVGKAIMRASTESNLKPVTLELGGKSPTIVFDDADLEQAVKWAAIGIFANSGQVCTAGSRIFVQEGIYDKFLEKMTEIAKGLASATGDPFEQSTQHGPLVSQTQFDVGSLLSLHDAVELLMRSSLQRVMSYIESGKSDGANVHVGGVRHGNEGYFVQPTIFTDVKPEMKIMREEIFGPVAAVVKFQTEEEVIEAANNTTYGLACNVFSQNASRALRVAHQIEAGTAWVNCAQTGEFSVPFGGYKQSGIGREMGESALAMYTQIKSVHVNIGLQL
ncbi:putative aldehyde dehydrogenase family protein [Lyophyllum shimeji]|uniref:Aldehyde dehydrogenase family protein n=1 Tax=Lyophyllum shimeji TaxID=47721 RepID=A0A9P3PWN1_LYOSH|nr:putative aldehyde dehydrogenase family protein [Lyophyllum shimeji]